MKTGILAGVICGLVIGGLMVIVLLKAMNADHSIKCKYDERQQLVRGKGFKYAFFTLLGYNLLAGMLNDLVFKKPIMDMPITMALGAIIGVLVYVLYCIWNEGYISLNENPKKVMIAFTVIGIANIGLGIGKILHEGLTENGMLTIDSINLLLGVMMLITVGALAIKSALNKKEEA